MVMVRGVELAVDEAGEGPPFVWGHGLTSSRAQENRARIFDWSGLTERFRIIRYDARGHGESGASAEPDDYAYSLLGADLLALADALGLDRLVVGGASMGAATALHAAVQVPGRILALVLVIPPTAWETRRAQRELYEAGADLVEQKGLEAFADLSALEPPPPVFADVADAVAEAQRANLLQQDATTFPAVIRGVARSDLPDQAAVAQIDAPAFILAWSGDPGHPLSTADRLHALLDRSELEVAHSLEDVLSWPARVGEFLDQAT